MHDPVILPCIGHILDELYTGGYTAVVDKLVNPELVAGEESRRSTETYRCSCQQHLAELTEYVEQV